MNTKLNFQSEHTRLSEQQCHRIITMFNFVMFDSSF